MAKSAPKTKPASEKPTSEDSGAEKAAPKKARAKKSEAEKPSPYAIVADGRRQVKVHEGQVLDIQYREVAAGDKITFDRVLVLAGGGPGAPGPKIGQPVVSGLSITAEVVGPAQGEKVFVQKFRRRKNSRRRTGHRQLYTRVKIGKIG